MSSQHTSVWVWRCSVLLAVTGILTTARLDFWQKRASINSTTGLMTEHGTPWAGLLVEPFIQVSQQVSAKTPCAMQSCQGARLGAAFRVCGAERCLELLCAGSSTSDCSAHPLAAKCNSDRSKAELPWFRSSWAVSCST